LFSALVSGLGLDGMIKVETRKRFSKFLRHYFAFMFAKMCKIVL